MINRHSSLNCDRARLLSLRDSHADFVALSKKARKERGPFLLHNKRNGGLVEGRSCRYGFPGQEIAQRLVNVAQHRCGFACDLKARDGQHR